jgi:integrase
LKAVLTDKLLRALSAKGEPHEPIWDQTIRGFGIRIGDHGGVSFFAMSRPRGHGRNPIRLTIGRFPTLTLAEARERARSLLRELHDGIDPRLREAERIRAEAAKRANTFGAVAEEFLRRHVAQKRTARAIELRIRRELIARWSDRPITEISRADVVRLVDEIVDRGHPEATRQTFTYGRRLFSWALARDIYGLGHSPFDRLNTRDLIGEKKPRQRLLSPLELALIWRASPEDLHPDGPYVRLLLLLGVRRTELARARWAEFDLDEALWTIPPGRMKSDEPHVVALAPPALEILNALPRSSNFVFTARGDKPLNNFGELKQRLDLRINALNGDKPIEPFTFHDCRRTFRTGLSSLAIAPHVAEMCIAHRQPALHRTYDLHRFNAERRHAFNVWATYLTGVVSPAPKNVVTFSKSAGAS